MGEDIMRFFIDEQSRIAVSTGSRVITHNSWTIPLNQWSFVAIQVGGPCWCRLEFILGRVEVCFRFLLFLSVEMAHAGAILPCWKDTMTSSNANVFTRGQFWLSGIVVACVCVCVSINHGFVRAITHQPFKLGSPNLDQMCKRPWLRALLFCGMIDRDLQGQI